MEQPIRDGWTEILRRNDPVTHSVPYVPATLVRQKDLEVSSAIIGEGGNHPP